MRPPHAAISRQAAHSALGARGLVRSGQTASGPPSGRCGRRRRAGRRPGRLAASRRGRPSGRRPRPAAAAPRTGDRTVSTDGPTAPNARGSSAAIQPPSHDRTPARATGSAGSTRSRRPASFRCRSAASAASPNTCGGRAASPAPGDLVVGPVDLHAQRRPRGRRRRPYQPLPEHRADDAAERVPEHGHPRRRPARRRARPCRRRGRRSRRAASVERQPVPAQVRARPTGRPTTSCELGSSRRHTAAGRAEAVQEQQQRAARAAR